MIHRGAVLLVTSALVAGCGSRQSAGGVPACDVEVAGPLLAASSAPGAVPAATGGTIADGVYDVESIRVHGRSDAVSDSTEPPSFRFSYRFTNDTRASSANHTEGAMVVAAEVPPQRSCETVRYATLGTVLRFPLHGKMVEDAYTATADTLSILHVQNGNGVAVTVLRRRP